MHAIFKAPQKTIFEQPLFQASQKATLRDPSRKPEVHTSGISGSLVACHPCSQARDALSAQRRLSDMEDAGFQPQCGALLSLASLCFQQRQYSAAASAFRDIEQRGMRWVSCGGGSVLSMLCDIHED